MDAEAEVARALRNERLTAVDVDDLKGDLTLELTSDYRLEMPSSATGYESFGISLNGYEYAGGAWGELSIAVPTDRPQVFVGRRVVAGFGTPSPTWE